jgi:thiol-disulfide isomerase/thioredoxin
MRYILVFILPFLLTQIASCKDFTIDGRFEAFNNDNIFLAEYLGDDLTVIDSCLSDKKGKFKFTLDDKDEAGMYKIIPTRHNLSDKNIHQSGITVIFNYEDITVESASKPLSENVDIKGSHENTLYYTFRNKMHKHQLKLKLLMPLVDKYPPNDEFHSEICDEFVNIQNNWNNYIDEKVEKNKDAFVSKIMVNYKKAVMDANMNMHERTEFIKDHHFDYINFNDTALLRTNVFNNLIIDYLSLYRNKHFSPREQENAFINAVDSILIKAYINPTVYTFVLNYLIDGFEMFKMESVLNHIGDNYIDKNRCNKDEETAIKKRLENYQKFAVGKRVPDFVIEDQINDKELLLSDIQSKYVLLIFWASWCPHCRTTLPKIKKIYDNYPRDKFEVVSISLDTSSKNYMNYIDDYNFDWINHNDYGGWNSEIALKYNVYATPTMFLVDDRRIIRSKPITFEELQKTVNTYLE